MVRNVVYVLRGKTIKGTYYFLNYDSWSGGYPHWSSMVSIHFKKYKLERALKTFRMGEKDNYICKISNDKNIESVKLFKVDFENNQFTDITGAVLNKEKLIKSGMNKLTRVEKEALGLT